MNPGFPRLLIAISLFLGWMGFLALQVRNTTRGVDGKPLRLSSPQFLLSEMDIIGEEISPGKIKIQKILFSSLDQATPKIADVVQIKNLEQARGYSSMEKNWLIPIRSLDQGKTLEVMPIPPSPGFSGDKGRIYPSSPGILAQYDKIRR